MSDDTSAIDAHLGVQPGESLLDVQDFARRDLRHAVEVALARDGSLLTAGESALLRAWLTLPDAPMSLFARLFGRQPRVFWLDELSYAEVVDAPAAARALVEAGFAFDAAALAPAAWLAEASTVPELKAAAVALGRPAGGLRADLVARLSDPEARPALVRPGLWLRHRGLFRRLCRLYLHDHAGDLSRFVVARLGLLRPPPYTPTGGQGLFPRRADLIAYEAALERMSRSEDWDEETLLAEGQRALETLEATPAPPDWRRRFSARRFDEGVAFAAARALERRKQPEAAEAIYGRLLSAGLRHAPEAALRRALCLDALGRPEEGAALCASARRDADPALTIALDRTGRRLARRAKLGWEALPSLRAPRARQVTLEAASPAGRRPGWVGGGRDGVVEEALAGMLAAHGRRAVFGENELWTSLFGLLFRDVLFAPVPGMLPTPLLHAPLDLGTPGFAERRRPLIEDVLAAIAAGEAAARLQVAAAENAGLAIAGVRWDRFDASTLLEVARAVDPSSLAAILRFFAEDWRGATSGLPDLCLLPGPACALEGAEPDALPPELLLVEAKGPTDAVRDAQRVWHDRLLAAGLNVEIWWVSARG